MTIIITKSGPEKSWYSESIGQTFEVIEPPTWAIGSDDNAFYIKHSCNSSGQALFVWKEDCELVLPEAIGTTAILSEAEAVSGPDQIKE